MTQKSKIIHIVTVSVLVFIVLLFAAMLINIIRLSRANNQVKALESKISEINRQIDENQDEIDLKESNEYIERYAREWLNMKKRNEKVIKGK